MCSQTKTTNNSLPRHFVFIRRALDGRPAAPNPTRRFAVRPVVKHLRFIFNKLS
uniref:ORF-56 protein n=1 Tax=Lymantria dispar multicapsid nuclear polyhedrosis virus TaxID=10449 RepID=V9TH95_NPVLD|nr:ORF-56 protein [Lymantria dispar multiple nucleopolyhedrovirus]AMO27731.1 hypothetical protein [Lymantria dispar multiple nucleopolyhedrovirus]QDE14915.1 hypothetical protein LdMNPV-J2_00059 [Lymantria dispar multiple nucleopolyhedrovirus]QDH05903.1 ORF58 [Lymantria dispar multiple nucleopolyhedrovirus]QPD01854.1 hypothetical protein [Lymantria dispar multiple nucleopolyhedrovirus]